MDVLFIGLFFVLGLICGTCCYEYGIRVPVDTFSQERSWHCPSCKEKLKWYELIPFIKRKCPRCQKRFPLLYPSIQLLTGFAFVMCYIRFAFDPFLIFSLPAVSFAVIIMVSDIRYQVVPNAVLILFLPVIIGRVIIHPIFPFWSHIAGLILAFILVLIIVLLSKGRMKLGDWKYFSLLGFGFGWEAFLLMLFLSMVYAFIGNLLFMVTGKESLKSRVSFGPYISLAALTVLFFGQEMISLFLSL